MVLRKKMPPTKSPRQETTEVHQEQLRRCFDTGRRKRKSQEMGDLLFTEMLEGVGSFGYGSNLLKNPQGNFCPRLRRKGLMRISDIALG